MDRRRDGAARRRWTTLDVESGHRKRTHAPARGRQASEEGRRVTTCTLLFADGVATGV